MKLKLLELFSGSGKLSKTFIDNGHEAKTLDLNKEYDPDICIDILKFDISLLDGWKPDIIHASPECKCFSVASIGHHWTGGKCAYIPKTEDAKQAIKIIYKTINIIEEINPINFFIENPRGVLRKLEIMQNLSKKYFHHEICYCRYGHSAMKPTDIWTKTRDFVPRPMCHNGDPDHESAPRGSRKGTQGLKNAYIRATFPKELCNEILKASERSYTFRSGRENNIIR